MKKIFRKHVNYDYINKKTKWLVKGRHSYEGYMHYKKKRIKLIVKIQNRMFNHWIIKRNIRRDQNAN